MDNEELNEEVVEGAGENAPETPPVEAAEPAAEPAPPGPSPWQSDLEAAFEEPEVRSRVDEYLRSKVQPYVTQLEQQSAPNRDANRLWESFHEDPLATYEQVTREVLDEERAERIAAILRGEEPDEDDGYGDWDDDEDEDEGTQQYPPEIQELIEERQRQQYESVLEDVKTKLEEEGVPFHRQQFEPYIVAHDGNLDKAVASYREWVGEAKELFGIKVPKPEDIPPPAINSDTRAGSVTPPVEESYNSLDDAVDAFFKEQNTAPPNVGAV